MGVPPAVVTAARPAAMSAMASAAVRRGSERTSTSARKASWSARSLERCMAGSTRSATCGELKRLRIDEKQLLLETDGEGLAGAEAMLVAGEAGVGWRLLAAERSLAGRPSAARPLRVRRHGLSPSAARAAIRPNTSAAASPLA